MTDDLFDEFLEYDFTMDVDVVKYPHYGKDVSCSFFFNNNQTDCLECGKSIKRK